MKEFTASPFAAHSARLDPRRSPGVQSGKALWISRITRTAHPLFDGRKSDAIAAGKYDGVIDALTDAAEGEALEARRPPKASIALPPRRRGSIFIETKMDARLRGHDAN